MPPNPLPAPQALPLVIEVRELEKAAGVPDQYLGGVWQPPNGQGQCVLASDPYETYNHHRKYFYFNGHTLYDISPTVFESVQLELVRVTSAFHHSGRISVFPDDVTQFEAAPEDQGDDVIFWHHLTFRWPVRANGAPVGYSVVCGNTGTENHMYADREGQTWNRKLFPDPYRADRHRRSIRANPPIGSVNGSVSLLIALLAFTARPEGPHVENTLKNCIRAGPWGEPHCERSDGWAHGRGVLVKVYFMHAVNPANGAVVREVTMDHLDAYEASGIFV